MKQRKSGVNLHFSSKSQENNTDLVDTISALPDSILGYILSFLPTKQAVVTSILSKRWKFVWVTIHSLDFHYDGCCKAQNVGEDMKFIDYVNRVLLLHDGGLLNKFSLFWHPYCFSSHASSWINTAIARKVHDLSLFCEIFTGQFLMPISVFNCDSLQSLELNGFINVPEAIVVCLPRLKSLNLHLVEFESEESFEKLISGSPMLYYLRLNTSFNDGFTYVIYSTSLRRAELSFKQRCKLKLEASSLEYLDLRGHIQEFFVRKSLSSLVEAYYNINIYEPDFNEVDICNSIVEAVRAFDCVKTLTLSADAMVALSHASISLSTKFKRLMKLETYAYRCPCSPLQDFIQSSDNLEFLEIHQYCPDFLGESNRYDNSEWNTCVEVVPRCLSNSLKKVRLDGCKCYGDECDMICYVLKHGSALEIMQISYDGPRDGQEFELLQEMCGVPRKSLSCEVELSCW